jgi:uncharacterized coiled-coil protein SlyX
LPVQPDSRLEELEIKIAFLERAVQELGDGLRHQQLATEALRLAYERLLRHAESTDAPSPAGGGEIPPHY